MILCGVFQLSSAEKLKCEFKDIGYNRIGLLYTCDTASLATNNTTYIDGYIGVHKPYKNNYNVKAIYIHHTNTRYIPANLGSIFQLNAFTIHDSQLTVIMKNDFNEMQKLEYLSLKFNNLKSVPLDAFDTLQNLRLIDLGDNQLFELPNGIFSNNLNLERIDLENNKIKYLGTELFNGLSKLNKIDLSHNPCGARAYQGSIEIIQLKQIIISQCYNINEIPAATVTTSQQSLMIFKGTHLSSEGNLKCEFRYFNYNNGIDLYSCEVTSLLNPNNNLKIDGYTGVHKLHNSNHDIRGIAIHKTNTIYIPEGLGLVLNQLTAFLVDESQLVEIKAANFYGMKELIYFSLYENKLKSLPSDAFSTLPKLKTIYLSHNQIEQIPKDLFSNNLNLIYIDFDKNKIKIIDPEFINGLTNLFTVDLRNNICVNKNFNDATEIIKIRSQVEIKCKDPEKITKPNLLELQRKEFEERIKQLEKDLADAKNRKQNEQMHKVANTQFVVNKKSSQVKVGWQEKSLHPRK